MVSADRRRERRLCAQMFKVIELDELEALLIKGAGVYL
jgi:hypothetical protein